MKIKIDKIVIAQQTKSALKIKRSADFYLQYFKKFPDLGIFHSYPELIHAALLEANPEVSDFVPQPLKLYVGNRRYIPDCYYVENKNKKVVEIKPEGKMEEKIRIPVQEFLKKHKMDFFVISNEEILEQEQLGLNWLQIIRVINSGKGIETKDTKLKILDLFYENNQRTVGDFISQGNRLNSFKMELALYKLIYDHSISFNESAGLINYDTEVKLCK